MSYAQVWRGGRSKIINLASSNIMRFLWAFTTSTVSSTEEMLVLALGKHIYTMICNNAYWWTGLSIAANSHSLLSLVEETWSPSITNLQFMCCFSGWDILGKRQLTENQWTPFCPNGTVRGQGIQRSNPLSGEHRYVLIGNWITRKGSEFRNSSTYMVFH